MLASSFMASFARGSFWETVMRFTPASILLASALALSASSGMSQKTAVPAPNGKAAAWVAKGQDAMAAGNLTSARDAYETALLLSPQDSSIYLALGKIARAQKLPGKAIRYYGRVLDLDETNQAALQGQGLAMMDKGATESARETLAKLRAICKANCAAAEPLVAAIAAGAPKVASAESKGGGPQ
jgi:tetratricopeptide (TPR) repeat protein